MDQKMYKHLVIGGIITAVCLLFINHYFIKPAIASLYNTAFRPDTTIQIKKGDTLVLIKK